MFDGLPVRGSWCAWAPAGARCCRAAAASPYPQPVRELLGEMAAAGVLMQSNIKFNGALVLQVYGDGPVKLAVAEVQQRPELSRHRQGGGRGAGRRAAGGAAQPARPGPLRDHARPERPPAGPAALPGRGAAAWRPARAAAAAVAGARALHAAVRAARHAAGAGGRRPHGRRPADPALAGRRPEPHVRRAQRGPDRPQRGLQPHRPPGGHADARRTADAGCRHRAAPPVLGGAAAALRAAAAALCLQLRARARAQHAARAGRATRCAASSPSAARSRSAASSAASSTASMRSTWARCSRPGATSRVPRRRCNRPEAHGLDRAPWATGGARSRGRRSVRTHAPGGRAGRDRLRRCGRPSAPHGSERGLGARGALPADQRKTRAMPAQRRTQQRVHRLAHMRRRRAAGRRPPRAGRARTAASCRQRAWARSASA